MGDVIDILGICTTLFGVVATLGYSAIRLAAACLLYTSDAADE